MTLRFLLLLIFVIVIPLNTFSQDSISKANQNKYLKDTIYIKNLDTSKIFSTNKIEENIFKDYIAPGIAILLSGAAFVFSIISLFMNLKVKRNENVKILFEMWKGTNNLDISKFIQPDFINAINAMSFTSSCWIYEIVNREIIFSNFYDSFCSIFEFSEKNADHPLVGLNQKTISECITSDIKKTFREMEKFKK